MLLAGIDSAQLIVWLYDDEGDGTKRIVSIYRNNNSKIFSISDDINNQTEFNLHFHKC